VGDPDGRIWSKPLWRSRMSRKEEKQQKLNEIQQNSQTAPHDEEKG
jgi:hypothetical protein